VLTYDVGDPVFETLEQRLAERAVDAPAGLPFDFVGGYVGYFGYELKADCGGRARHEADTPDAVWVFVDRLVVVDHEERNHVPGGAGAGWRAVAGRGRGRH
jgi:para-aminobenzoate synthetase